MPGLVSALIVTRRRPALLDRCVRSLLDARAAAPGVALEIVVHVNGRDPESMEVLGALEGEARGLGIELRCREEAGALSPAGARNRALADARGPWVFFVDDDVRVPRAILADFERILARFPEASALGGPNLTPPGSSVFQRASGLALASPLATWQSVPRYRAVGAPRPCGEESLILCNLFVRRDALGPEPFRERLRCGEENWLIRGLSRATSRSPGQVIYAPELQVWHERRPSLPGFARQIFWYGCGRGQNLRLALGESGIERRRYLVPSLCLLYAAATFLYALGSRELPRPLAAPYVAYAGLCLAAIVLALRAREEDLTTRALSALLVPVIHAFYGAGVLFGLSRKS